MVQPPLPLWSIFLVDTSCLMRLDGLDWPLSDKPAFSQEERRQVWEGLLDLAREGRLKLIKQVKKELKRLHPTSLRLVEIQPTRMPPTNNELRRRYQWLVEQFPGLVPDDPIYDPADPWLIVAAQQYGYIVVTEELPEAMRRRRRRSRRPSIPDVCDAIAVQWTSLRELAATEGWI